MEDANRSTITGTRDEILAVLCRGNRTVAELARELGLARNTVRAHLDRLEAAGLVRHRVVRRGVGKPAFEYELTGEGSLRLSRAYLPLLAQLVAASIEHFGEAGAEEVLRLAGRRLAAGAPAPSGSLRRRADATVELLEGLGAAGSLREEHDGVWIEGGCCPLRALVADQPLACKAIEALVEEFTGLEVREACERRAPPRCRLRLRESA